MGIRELRQEASRMGIKYSGLKKAQLEPLVTAALAAEQPVEKISEKPEKASLPVSGSDDGSVVSRLAAGSIEETGAFLSLLTKSEARKVRRELRAAGFNAHAAAKRITRRERMAA